MVVAAIIMVSVFAGFAFSDDPMIKQFGFALAVGVVIDAFLVRMTVVPAVMSLLGEHAWWVPLWPTRWATRVTERRSAECRRPAGPEWVAHPRGLWSLPNGAESFCPTAWGAGRLQT